MNVRKITAIEAVVLNSAVKITILGTWRSSLFPTSDPQSTSYPEKKKKSITPKIHEEKSHLTFLLQLP